MPGGKGIEDVVIIKEWDNYGNNPNPGNAVKAPSVIAYQSENPDEDCSEDQWGFAADGLKSYSWTKLLLGKESRALDPNDPSVRKLFGPGHLQTPLGKGAKDVVTDYLRFLYSHFMKKIERSESGHGNATVAIGITPIEFWVTVPAIWTDAAKTATLEAASAAGFGSRPIDSIKIITEPEAAALAVLGPRVGVGTVTGLDVIIDSSGC
jgi:hypothetical protein